MKKLTCHQLALLLLLLHLPGTGWGQVTASTPSTCPLDPLGEAALTPPLAET